MRIPTQGAYGSRLQILSLLSTLTILAPAVALYGIYFVAPQLDLFSKSFLHNGQMSLGNYTAFLADNYQLAILARTAGLGIVVVLITLVLGVPLAYLLARSTSKWAATILLMTTLPLMISVVVRSFGWMVLFFRNGAVSKVAAAFGFSDPPVQLMYTFSGVAVSLAQVLLPVMVVTLYGSFRSVGTDYENAAISLGASAFTAFWLVTLRMARGGIVAGSLLVFALAISSYATPSLIGGARVKVMATSIYEAAIELLDWPTAATLSVILLLSVLTITVLYSTVLRDRDQKGAFHAG